MPNGRFRPVAKSVFISATPSPSASRSRTILFGLGPEAPAFRCRAFAIQPSMLLAGLVSVVASETRTSPLGRTSSQRGWSSPDPNRVTVNPAGAVGWTFAGQPTALRALSVGRPPVLGSGRIGLGPNPTKGSIEPCEQAARARPAA